MITISNGYSIQTINHHQYYFYKQSGEQKICLLSAGLGRLLDIHNHYGAGLDVRAKLAGANFFQMQKGQSDPVGTHYGPERSVVNGVDVILPYQSTVLYYDLATGEYGSSYNYWNSAKHDVFSPAVVIGKKGMIKAGMVSANWMSLQTCHSFLIRLSDGIYVFGLNAQNVSANDIKKDLAGSYESLAFLDGGGSSQMWIKTDKGQYNVNYTGRAIPSVLAIHGDPAVSESNTKKEETTMSDVVMDGIDVSHWQNDIDWDKVKAAGYKFAMIKAGGSDAGFYKDVYFEKNYAGAVKAGLHVGAYYFVGGGFVSKADGIADAKRFLNLIAGKKFDMPVYLDLEAPIEATKTGNTEAAIAFCKTLEEAGYFAGIYASDVSGFVNRLDRTRLTEFSWWVARYGSAPKYAVPYGMWQYSSTGKVNGIHGNVDLNHCYVDFPSIIVRKKLNGYSVPETPKEPEVSEIDVLKDEIDKLKASLAALEEHNASLKSTNELLTSKIEAAKKILGE